MHGTDRVTTEYSTTPARPLRHVDPSSGAGWAFGITLTALGLFGLFAVLLLGIPTSQEPAEALTLLVFIAAVVGWTTPRLGDTHVSLTAAAALVALGVLETEDLFDTWGSEAMWLLATAFLLAAGVSRTGLPTRLAVNLAGRARSPRRLVHLVTAGLLVSALLVPSTSGRAVLALPVHRALARAFADRERLVRTLAVLFPTVVLLSAVASLVGAGAHLVTSRLLAETTGEGIGFLQWLWWGAPIAVVSSHVAAELVLMLFTKRGDRGRRLRISARELREHTDTPPRMTREEIRAGGLLLAVAALWTTEALHGFPPAFVGLCAALLITAPGVGTIRLKAALDEVPWSLLLFMAATTALGIALVESGVSGRLVGMVPAGGMGLVVTVIVASAAAHLLVQSRSARSSVLIPLVIPAAIGAGMSPTALAFASTTAAGFCHTLPSSAKPVAMFADIGGPTYSRQDLLRLSAVLGPVLVLLVLLFSTVGWPLMGLPLHR
ncbi:SLC13 family permease [Parasphingorhabdus pacifica]